MVKMMMDRLGKLDGDVHRKRKELENLMTYLVAHQEKVV